MKFELFLTDITQEMIDARRPIGRGGTAADGWSGNVWSKSCCIINCLHQRGQEVVLPADRGLLLRSEPDGGLVWSPMTNGVYKVDAEAYSVMRDLDEGYSERETAKRNGVTLRTVKSFVDKVEKTLRSAK